MLHFKRFHDAHPNIVVAMMIVMAVTFLLMFGALMQGCDHPPQITVTGSPSPTPTAQADDATAPPTAPPPTDQTHATILPPAQKNVEVVSVEAKGEVDATVRLRVHSEIITIHLSGNGDVGSQCFTVRFGWSLIRIDQSYPVGCKP